MPRLEFVEPAEFDPRTERSLLLDDVGEAFASGEPALLDQGDGWAHAVMAGNAQVEIVDDQGETRVAEFAVRAIRSLAVNGRQSLKFMYGEVEQNYDLSSGGELSPHTAQADAIARTVLSRTVFDAEQSEACVREHTHDVASSLGAAFEAYLGPRADFIAEYKRRYGHSVYLLFDLRRPADDTTT